MKLWTDAIDNGYFDPRYTCDSDNSSPELRWAEAPDGTRGFALVAEDRSTSEPFVHWVIYNIPGDLQHLPAGIPPQDTLPNGIRQGTNSYGKLGYAGPCPPRARQANPTRGSAHRYVFTLYALRENPSFSGRITRDELLSALGPHVVATAELEGRYERVIQQAG